MEKTILNIDSRDVVNNNPPANNATFWDFEPFVRTSTKTTLLPLTLANNNNPNLFNPQQTQIETVRTGFRQIKNVKRITISNIKWFYTTGGNLSNVTTNLGMYRLMRINDLGNVEANDGSKYTTKLDLYFDQNESYLIPTIRTIEFDKPTDLKKLRIRFYHPNNGNPIAPTTKGTIGGLNNDLALFFDTVPAPGGVVSAADADDPSNAVGIPGLQTSVNNLLYRFSFTLEVESIPNSISKSYEEMFNYSDELLKRMAYTKMIEFCDRENKKDENSVDNLAAQMNHTMTNIHNQQEFQYDGQRINYGYNGFPNNK